jgi:two-component system sensor histidine kinase RegB
LRWIAICGQTASVLIVYFGLDFALPLKSCLAVIAASAWVNVILMVTRRNRRRISERNVFWQLVFDTLQLAILLGLTGGVTNPFLILFAAPVVVAFTSLRVRYASILFLLVTVLLGLMAIFSLPLPGMDLDNLALSSRLHSFGMVAATLIAIAFTSVYVWRVSSERNQMGGALAATEAVLARERRLAALGGLAAATAHELGTPLGTIQLVANELNRDLGKGCDLHEGDSDCPIREDIALILSQAKVCRQILGKLSAPGAEEDLFHARLGLSALIEEIVAPQMSADISLEVQVKSRDPGNAPKEPMLQRQPEIMHAVSAFVENGLSFAFSRVKLDGRWDHDWVSITICDDGPGFDPSVLERLGEPYVTSRLGGDAKGQGGLGLGFFISKNLIERTGGKITCGSSSALGGAMVQIVWPRDRVEFQSGSGQTDKT